MKHWVTNGIITFYLSVLTVGVAAHAVQYNEHSHPFSYFVIWDMFCGWSSWEMRAHILAEGESGTYYELSPVPWGAYSAYSENMGREHYDPYGHHMLKQAKNTLTQTSHEPIRRILIVEEVWAKKYNLPDQLAAKLTPHPSKKQSYVHVRDVFLPCGTAIDQRPSWLALQTQAALMDNPRLQQSTLTGQAMMAMKSVD
jgi:hypothetical protein